jgi:hypothetical protein
MVMRKKAAASLKKNHSKTYRADQAFAKTTGVGKTAQASRGMNIFAKENIPKGYTVQAVKLKDGNNIALVGLTKNASALKRLRSQPSGYQNPNVPGKKKTVAPTTRTKKNPFKRTRSK